VRDWIFQSFMKSGRHYRAARGAMQSESSPGNASFAGRFDHPKMDAH